jgi:hypothetical protein
VTPSRDLVITGLPRSGTSFLCARLNALPGVAVINEPDDVFKILLRPRRRLARLWRLAHRPEPAEYGRQLHRYHAALRARLAAGQSVPNKTAEDTGLVDEHVPWRPARVAGDDFVLATKNTLLYTCNVGAIVSQPFGVIAMVRNPRDSIKSWQGAPAQMAHLREARIPFFARLHPTAVGRDAARRYAAIHREPDPIRRLAGLWNFLTDFYLAHRPRLVILRYEDVVADPGRALSQVLGRAAGPPGARPARPPRTYAVTPAEADTIAMACGVNARALGYADPRGDG